MKESMKEPPGRAVRRRPRAKPGARPVPPQASQLRGHARRAKSWRQWPATTTCSQDQDPAQPAAFARAEASAGVASSQPSLTLKVELSLDKRNSPLSSRRARPSGAVAPNRPEGHGSAADPPRGQYDPATHAEHDVCPAIPWYVPASHGSHTPCPGCGCTVPGLHSAGSAAPVEQKDPEGQTLQSPTLVITAGSRSW